MLKFTLDSMTGGHLVHVVFPQQRWCSDTLGWIGQRALVLLDNGRVIQLRASLSRPGGRWYAELHAQLLDERWSADDIAFARGAESNALDLVNVTSTMTGYACFLQVEPQSWDGRAIRDCLAINLVGNRILEIESVFCRPDGGPSAAMRVSLIEDAEDVLRRYKTKFKKPSFWTPELEAIFGTSPAPDLVPDKSFIEDIRKVADASPNEPIEIELEHGDTITIMGGRSLFLPPEASHIIVAAVANDTYLTIPLSRIAEVRTRDAAANDTAK